MSLSWFTGTTRTWDKALVLVGLANRFGVVKVRNRGLQWYRQSATVGALDVMVGWEPVSGSSSPDEVYVSVPQSALDTLGWAGQVAFARDMDAQGFRASRVDFAWDDRARTVDPSTVHLALERRDTLTHSRVYRQVSDSQGGYTTYIGSRKGECMIRTYRKWAEAADDREGVRWEMETKGDRAPLALALIIGSPVPAVTFWGLMRAFVDFRDRADHVRGDESPVLAWWSSLIGSAERVRLAGPVAVDSFARRLAWLRRSVAPTLALAFAQYGSEGVNDLIRDGWPRARWELVGLDAAP